MAFNTTECPWIRLGNTPDVRYGLSFDELGIKSVHIECSFFNSTQNVNATDLWKGMRFSRGLLLEMTSSDKNFVCDDII